MKNRINQIKLFFSLLGNKIGEKENKTVKVGIVSAWKTSTLIWVTK